jgi:CHAT domain-containing protein
MRIFGGNQFKALIGQYKKAQNLYLQGDYDALFSVTLDAIHTLKKETTWPFLTLRNSEPITRGSLHYFRAFSQIEQQKQLGHFIPADIAKSILNDLEIAIEFLRRVRRAKATVEMISILYANTLVHRLKNVSSDHALRCLQYLELTKESAAKNGRPQNLAAALGCGAYVLTKCFPTQIESIKKGIHYLKNALQIYGHIDDKVGLLATKTHLARLYLHPLFRTEASNVEKALIYASQALEGCLESGPTRLSILALIASALSYRRYGDTTGNRNTALWIYQNIIEQNGAQYVAQSPYVILDWIQLLFESGGITSQLDRAHQYIDTAIEFFEKNDNNHQSHFTALAFRFQISKLQNKGVESSIADKTLYMKGLSRLQSCLDLASEQLLWVDIEWRRYGLGLPSQSRASKHERLKYLVYLSETVDLTLEPHLNFEINANIACQHFFLEQWQEGNKHAQKALAEALRNINGSFIGFSPELYDLPASRETIRELPFGALMADDVSTALILFDIIHSRQIDTDLETLLIISARTNADSLRKNFNNLKKMQRVPYVMEHGNELSEIALIEKAIEELEQVSALNSELSRSFFLENLDRQLSLLESWVFIPLLGHKRSRFLLVPPKSTFKDIHLSPMYEFGYISISEALVGKNSQFGWLKIFSDLRGERLDLEIARIQEYLWEVFGQWVVSIIKSHTSEGEVPHLCVVQNGFLQLFPFAFAKDRSTGKHLIDFVSISYAPSLYSIFSVEQRLKKSHEELAMTFVCGSSDPNLKFAHHESHFVTSAFGSARTRLFNNLYSVEGAVTGLRNSNHWHFSSHGKFDWSDPSASSIDLADLPFYASYLEILEPKCNLRLVTLAACESGVHSSLRSDADMEGFANKFLSLGSLGVLSYLWRIPDAAATLISERFYHHYVSGQLSPAAALRMAQIWVRDATKLDILQLAQSYSHCLSDDEIGLWRIGLEVCDNTDKPFDDPIYWGSAMLFGQ